MCRYTPWCGQRLSSGPREDLGSWCAIEVILHGNRALDDNQYVDAKAQATDPVRTVSPLGDMVTWPVTRKSFLVCSSTRNPEFEFKTTARILRLVLSIQ